jgi:Holliday junction resolvase RusA-like endonuclease
MKFTILGEPVPKGRPIITTANGYARSYTPKKTRDAEGNMRAQIVSQLPKGWKLFDEPISIFMFIFRSKPKSAKKSDRYPSRRPDLDNFIKSMMDSMNGVVFKDDACICRIEATKLYSEIPRIEVWIDKMDMEGGIHD